jgi:NAD(P)-dependent dehydrogenase (short-subunit alcohol dehydrogenase family)
VDVRSGTEVDELVTGLARTGELPQVFILNAGINRIDNDESFDLAVYEEVLVTNLYGVLHFVQPLTRLPSGGVPRHVVAVGSMASYVGNPYGLGYHTSKKALAASFDVWSRMYSETDLVFQQVLLGPIRTGMFTMSDELPAWMGHVKEACSGSLDAAVGAISRFARTRKRRLYHPPQAVPLYLGMRLGQSLVPGLFQGRKTLAGKARRARG